MVMIAMIAMNTPHLKMQIHLTPRQSRDPAVALGTRYCARGGTAVGGRVRRSLAPRGRLALKARSPLQSPCNPRDVIHTRNTIRICIVSYCQLLARESGATDQARRL
jgi:hypothetical protein